MMQAIMITGNYDFRQSWLQAIMVTGNYDYRQLVTGQSLLLFIYFVRLNTRYSFAEIV